MQSACYYLTLKYSQTVQGGKAEAETSNNRDSEETFSTGSRGKYVLKIH